MDFGYFFEAMWKDVEAKHLNGNCALAVEVFCDWVVVPGASFQ